ncbi:MAG: hypothetical protein N2Z74_06095, partial [Syntrophales bacterium]|nr:hypothetical protein [Syntrophales bacterium]
DVYKRQDYRYSMADNSIPYFLRFLVFSLLLILVLLFPESGACVDDKGSKLQDLTDHPLEELLELEVDTVTTASRYRQPIGEAPASVSVVTATEIKRTPPPPSIARPPSLWTV